MWKMIKVETFWVQGLSGLPRNQMFQNNQKPYIHMEGNISRDREREKKQDKKTGKIGKNITNVFLYFIFSVNLVYFFWKKHWS